MEQVQCSFDLGLFNQLDYAVPTSFHVHVSGRFGFFFYTNNDSVVRFHNWMEDRVNVVLD